MCTVVHVTNVMLSLFIDATLKRLSRLSVMCLYPLILCLLIIVMAGNTAVSILKYLSYAAKYFPYEHNIIFSKPIINPPYATLIHFTSCSKLLGGEYTDPIGNVK